MRRLAALFPIVLAISAIILAPRIAEAQDGREEGPFEIEKCQTISQPGSYRLAKNLAFSGSAGGACLSVTADFVTIDLAGFSISSSGVGGGAGVQVVGSFPSALRGIAVRNGSISNFQVGVDLDGAQGSIVEGLRLFGPRSVTNSVGIRGVNGVVRGNTVFGFSYAPLAGPGISATGLVTGNYVSENRSGMTIGRGSTVIGNAVLDNGFSGIVVDCPSNVTDNTIVGSGVSLELTGMGCNLTNNVAP